MTTDKNRNEYRLNHWKLVGLEETAAASGNLHDRTGFPEGVVVETSVIHSWDLVGENLILYTANSVYRCSLKEYVISSDSLSLLNCVESRSGLPVEDLEEMAWNLAEKAVVYYKNLLDQYGSPSCVLFQWEGCDMPYLKQVLLYENGNISIDDLPHAAADSSYSIGLSGSMHMTVRPTNSFSRHFYRYGDENSLQLIENTGRQDIFTALGGKQGIRVPAESIVKLQFLPDAC